MINNLSRNTITALCKIIIVCTKTKKIFTFAYHREETQVPETGYLLYQMLFVLLCFLCKPVAECINEINQCQAPVGVHAQVTCDAEKSHMDSEKNTATYIPEF